MMKARRVFSLEEYVDFRRSDRQSDLTASCLNQIISMHGFKKIRGKNYVKTNLLDAVKEIDLIDPARSTLKECVSPQAFLELDDVIADLNALNWHECCTTSIKTFCKENNPLAEKVDDSVLPLRAPNTKAKRDNKGQEKGKCPDELSTGGIGSSSDPSVEMTDARSGEKTENKRQKKKKKSLHIFKAASDGEGPNTVDPSGEEAQIEEAQADQLAPRPGEAQGPTKSRPSCKTLFN